MNEPRLKIRVTREPLFSAVGLIFYHGDMVVKPTEMKEVTEQELFSARPIQTLKYEDAQVLMDDLWQAGIRPTEGAGSAGQKAALEDHLQDMRAIAFSKLKIEAPK